MKWINIDKQLPEKTSNRQVYLVSDGWIISTSIWFDNGNGPDWNDICEQKIALHPCIGTVQILDYDTIKYWIPLYMPKIIGIYKECELYHHGHIYQEDNDDQTKRDINNKL
jgi:hypothetical protein